jgi:hypothetical protein
MKIDLTINEYFLQFVGIIYYASVNKLGISTLIYAGKP